MNSKNLNRIGQQLAAQLPWPQNTQQLSSQLQPTKIVMQDLIRHPEFTFKRVNTGFRIKCGMTVNAIHSIWGIYGFNNLVGLGYEF